MRRYMLVVGVVLALASLGGCRYPYRVAATTAALNDVVQRWLWQTPSDPLLAEQQEGPWSQEIGAWADTGWERDDRVAVGEVQGDASIDCTEVGEDGGCTKGLYTTTLAFRESLRALQVCQTLNYREECAPFGTPVVVLGEVLVTTYVNFDGADVLAEYGGGDRVIDWFRDPSYSLSLDISGAMSLYSARGAWRGEEIDLTWEQSYHYPYGSSTSAEGSVAGWKIRMNYYSGD